MSAIAGAVFTDGRDLSAAFLGRITEAAAPRGFDGVSQWRGGPAGLIRFHHATTPEAVGEIQPLAGPSGAVIAFDGRLDNRAELVALLGERGRLLACVPDVEIALALFEARGERMFHDLVGDWAMAIWQPQARRLLCARAPMGWRPFLWTYDGRTFGFATEPRALIVGLGLDRAVNEGVVGETLSARFATRTDSLWRHVSRLPPGELLVLENGRVQVRRWHKGPFEDVSHLSDAEHVERFRDLFDQALASAAHASTPVMSQLSGGLDSSSVVCRAIALHRAGRIDREVGAITARFPGRACDETEWSSLVEARFGVTAEVTAADPYDLDAAGRWCADTLQLPLRPNANDTVTAALRLLRAQGKRVLLTGEGGDDWLGGGIAHFPDLLRKGRIGTLFAEAMTQFPDLPRAERLRRAASMSIRPYVSRRYRDWLIHGLFTFDRSPPAWIRPEWAGRIGLRERWSVEASETSLPDFAQRRRYTNYVLARRATDFEGVQAYAEANGVEIRHPLHDLRLTRFIMGASGGMLRRNGVGKHLLREAMRDTLPEAIRHRRSKARFVDSIVDAMLEHLRRKPPAKLLPAQLGWIDAAEVERMLLPIRAWRAQGPDSAEPPPGVGAIWFIVAIDLWLENAAAL